MDVDEEDLDEGDALACEECGANLSVASLDPLELESLDEEEEEEDEDSDLDDEEEEEDDEDEDDEPWK
jgi:lysine biosynthesis protein LysW